MTHLAADREGVPGGGEEELVCILRKFTGRGLVADGGGIDEGASATEVYSPPKGAPGAAALAASPGDSTGQSGATRELLSARLVMHSTGWDGD